MRAEQRLYCRDILERIERIENSIAKGQEAFDRSYEIRDTIILRFIVIGEAAKSLDAELTRKHRNINWKGVAGFRDILIHQYRRTRLELVWRTAQEELPALKSAVLAMLADLEDKDSATE